MHKFNQKKFFKVAESGLTVDGRTIKPEWLTQAAESYDTALYPARINCEHIVGFRARGEFPAFGDVTALKTEKVGDAVHLYAEIDPTDDLVELVNTERQKVFTSVEIQPSFRDTGKAYMMGLAITDTPASVGTEMLKFARDKGFEGADALPMLSESIESQVSFSDAEKSSLLSTITKAFSKKASEDSAQHSGHEQRFSDHAKATKAVATEVLSVQDDVEKLRNDFAALEEKYAEQSEYLSEIKALLSQQDPEHTERPQADGQETFVSDF